MRSVQRRYWMVLGGVVVLAAAVIPAFGQQSKQGPEVLDALLAEVRGLRQAIEQMSSVGARVQLAMGRLQLQEQRINTMVRRLEGLRDQRSSIERETTELREQAARFEETAERGPDPEERKAAAFQGRQLARLAEQRAADLQRVTAEEAEVSNVIAVEQRRWTDINAALEELERALMR